MLDGQVTREPGLLLGRAHTGTEPRGWDGVVHGLGRLQQPLRLRQVPAVNGAESRTPGRTRPRIKGLHLNRVSRQKDAQEGDACDPRTWRARIIVVLRPFPSLPLADSLVYSSRILPRPWCTRKRIPPVQRHVLSPGDRTKIRRREIIPWLPRSKVSVRT